MPGAPILCQWHTWIFGGKESRLPCPALPQAHLGELALLIDEGDDVHGFVGDHVQGVLVVCELDVQPVNALQVILLLLQLEYVLAQEAKSQVSELQTHLNFQLP